MVFSSPWGAVFSRFAGMKKCGAVRPAARVVVALLALVAFSLSLWLTVQKLTGKIDTLAGCGAGSGCANVLGSKWSMVFGVVPVSVLSCLLYLGVLASLFFPVRVAGWFRLLAAWLCIGAAVWFTGLQLLVMHTICPYCMVMHGLGVLLGGGILVSEVKSGWSVGRAVLPLLVAVPLVAGLAAVQHFGPEPETHLVDDTVVVEETGDVDAGIHAAGEGRVVSFFNGRKLYRVGELPHLGEVDAGHVIVKYYDYTCEACRDVHGRLEKVMEKYPGKLAVVVLAVPLDRECNPHLPQGVKDHRDACKFARLSLRVWRAEPEKFREFHKWLFEFHDQPYEVAEAMAYSLVGAEKMDAVDAKWIDAVLAENVSDYRQLTSQTPVMPKILLKGAKVLHGVTRDAGTLEDVLQQELGF